MPDTASRIGDGGAAPRLTPLARSENEVVRIPRIAPYPMPARTQPGTGPAGWRPDPRRAALLIHDMQRYFVDFFPPGRSPTTELVGNTVLAREAASAAGLPVIYSAQPARMSRAERGLLHDIWGAGMTDCTAAEQGPGGHAKDQRSMTDCTAAEQGPGGHAKDQRSMTDCTAAEQGPGGHAKDERSMTGKPRHHEIIAELTPGPHDFVVTKYRYSAFFRTGLDALLSSLGRDQLIVCGVFAHIGCLFTVGDAFSRDIETFLLADGIADFSLRDHLMALDYAARLCAVTMTTNQLREALQPSLPRVAESARPARPAT